MDNLPASQPALIEAPNSITPGSKPWSTGLGKLLTEGEDGRSAVRLIAINRTLRAEVERIAPALERAKAPAPEEEILEILVRHAPHYGITAKVAGEWGAFFGAYLDALAGLPAYAIEDAFVRWNRGEGHTDLRMAGYYPKAPQLYLLASTARNELACANYRAKRALEYVEEKLPPQMTEEERKRNAEEIRRLAAQPTRRLPPQPPGVTLKEWAAQCRENGWTEETAPPMRAATGETPQQMAERIRNARPETVSVVVPAITADEVGDVI